MLFVVRSIIVLALLFLAIGCGGGSSTKAFTQQEKSYVHDLFATDYLWYDEVDHDINDSLYNTPNNLIKALRAPRDRWSFSLTAQEYNHFANQITAGFGFYTKSYQVTLVLIDSPADGRIQRGDTIVEIDDNPVSISALNSASKDLGRSYKLKILRDGMEYIVHITPREYTYKTVLIKILNIDGHKIGYFRYDSFSEASKKEIESAFTTLYRADIDELVIDIRYNHGGSVETASVLLNNITNAYPNQRQVYLDWNDKYQYKNDTYSFESRSKQDGNELDMSRVFFLTTDNSVSASELIISALKPYLGESNIITIGSQTAGKPVGMSAKAYNDNFYFLINFLVTNDDNVVSSFDGIPATCKAEDDFNREMGDPEEHLFAEAIYYIQYGECSPFSQERVSKKVPRASKAFVPPLNIFEGASISTPSLSHD